MTKRPANLATWLVAPLEDDVKHTVDRLRHAPGVERIALMPDVHLATDVCVGSVIGTQGVIYPQAVGGDIGCGMATVALDMDPELLDSSLNAAQVLAAFERALPILKRERPLDLPASESELSSSPLKRLAERDGRYQLGTVGRGNHFIEIQECDEGLIWVGVHSGSRSMGRAILREHTSRNVSPHGGLQASEKEGQAYLHDQEWALRYAEENRRFLLEAACHCLGELFGAEALWDSHIRCHHNFVAKERTDGQFLWIHRKGAISAKLDEAGIIPGSMGTATHHVRGRGCAQAMHSSSHGAGRTCSRAEVRRKISMDTLSRQMKGVWFDTRKASSLRDEAPGAYRDIGSVMRAQRTLTRITRTLRPRLSYKGS